MRRWAALLLVLAACGDGAATTTASTVLGLPSPAEPASYRYEAVLDFTVSTAEGESRFTGVKIGSFSSPDSHVVVSSFLADGVPGPEEQVTIIGADAWYNGGSGWEATSPADPRVRQVVSEFTSVDGNLVPVGDVYEAIRTMRFAVEQVGEYSTRRYTADSADPAVLQAMTGSGAFGSQLAAADLARLTLWVDEATGVIVRTRMEVSGGPGVLGGVPSDASVDLLLSVERSDLNDPAIEIVAPG